MFFSSNIRNKYFYLLLYSIINIFAYSYFKLTNLGYPLWGFMWSRVGRFDDYFNNLYSIIGQFAYSKGNFTFPPLGVLIYSFFSIFSINVGLILFFSIFIFLVIYSLSKFTKDLMIIFFIVISYPFLFTIARGNNEIIIFSFMILGFYFYFNKNYNLSFLTFSLMNLIEVYPTPFILFIKYFSQIKKTLLIFSFFIFLFIVCFTLFFNDLYDSYIDALIKSHLSYSTAIYPGSSLHSNGITNLIQLVYVLINDQFPFDVSLIQNLIRVITFISMMFLITLTLKTFKFWDNFDKTIMPILFWTLFVGISFDYKLIHFFIPFLVLFQERKLKFRKLFLTLFFLLFIPKPFFIITTADNELGLTAGSIINPLLLLTILGLVIYKIFSIHKIFLADKAIQRSVI